MLGQPLHDGRTVLNADDGVNEEGPLGGLGAAQRLAELLLSAHTLAAAAHRLGHARIILLRQIVVGARLVNVAQRCVLAVVHQNDDGVVAELDGGGEFVAGHEEAAVADQHDGAALGEGALGAHGARNTEAHAGVVARPQEQVGLQLQPREETVPAVGHHAVIGPHEFIQLLKHPDGREARDVRALLRQLGFHVPETPALHGLRLQEELHDVGQGDVRVAMVADRRAVSGGVDHLGGVHAGGEDARAEVGDERAERQNAVGPLDDFSGQRRPHGPHVVADEMGVAFGKGRLAHQGAHDGDVELLHETDHVVHEAVALDLHVHVGHGALAAVQARQDFGERLFDLQWAAGGLVGGTMGAKVNPLEHHVAGNFQVAGPLLLEHSVNDTVNVGDGGRSVVHDRRGFRNLLEDTMLRLKRLDAMVQEGVGVAVLDLRRAREDQDRRFLRIRLGDGIDHVQGARAVSDDGHAQPRDARVGVGGVTHPRLVAHDHGGHLARLLRGVQGQDEIAGDAEGGLHAEIAQTLEDVFRDFHKDLRSFRAPEGSNYSLHHVAAAVRLLRAKNIPEPQAIQQLESSADAEYDEGVAAVEEVTKDERPYGA